MAEMRFGEYVRQVRDVVLGALAASDVPFDRVVRAVQPRRDPSRHPLFQVLFSVEPPVAPFPAGWDLTQMEVTVGGAKFDLYLELDERPDGMHARFLYSTELFDASTIRRMIGHWLAILEAVAAEPDAALGDLPLLTADEQQLLLVEWNATARPLPPTTVHALFEDQARRTPDAIALTFQGADWSYRALDLAAACLALRLRAARIGPGALVALCVERSPDMLVGLLAILKAGAAYLPLDPEFPAARLALIIADAQPALLLSQRGLHDVLPATDAPLMFIDDEADVVDGGVAGRALDPENLAYVIYTSGSTGTPKGVELPHRAVVNLLQSVARTPGFTADDAMLAVTTVSFDIAALELFLPLVTGGRVILADRDTVADPRRLMAALQDTGASVMQATPALWRALVEAGWAGDPHLRIFCGGEALTRDLADKLLARGAALWNLYGPTETTIWSAVHRIAPDAGPVVIGRPLDNTALYVLDPAGRPVPTGVAGELHIGGAGLAHGYRNRPDLTAERFAVRAVAPGERLYATGDLARWRADGTVECLGRTDGQVKIRGYRVGLGEIEDALAAHPDVAGAALRVWRDGSGENSLVAYVVPRGAAAVDGAVLRAFLRITLPDYMVPTRFVAMDSLPLTPNAKVDRNALPEPTITVAPATTFVAPEGPVAETLAAIWRDLLEVSAVGADDDFFDLGGHSLLLARLLRRIEDTFDRRLALAQVFQAPTLGAMAALLAGPPAAATPGALPRTIVPFRREGARPPLFWLSPGPVFRPLAEAIGADQPILGVALDPAELNALPPPARFEDIAAFLVRDIRAVQPRGPYYVGGWCTGGILAYEVAAQLTAAGERVGLVLLLDAVNPVQYRGFGALAVSLSKLKFHLGHALVQTGAGGWRYAAERGRGAWRRVVQTWTPACLPPEFDDLLELAALDYVPPLYDGDVALFQPAQRPDVFDYRPGWRAIVRGRFTDHDVPGTHRTALDPPHVAALGAAMDTSLALAQAAQRAALQAAE
jgi:amino acid adenylation domain-containing protein